MYIQKIQINSFGCITDKCYSFDKGFNFIYGKNESGKSTFFAFIVFMFYGTKVKKAPGSLSFKEKYMPWNGKPMQGKIVFEHNGLNYELSRLISSAENTLSLFCVDTGEQVKDRAILNSPGEYFFGIGVQAFYNTCFIGDTVADYMSKEEIITKLTSVQSNSGEEVSYNSILDIIDNEISKLSSDRRKSAIIPELTSKLREISQKAERLQKISDNTNDLKSELEIIQNKISKTEAEISKLKNQQMLPNKNEKEISKIPFVFLGIIFFLLTIVLFVVSNTTIFLCFIALAFCVIVVLLMWLKKMPGKENDTKLFTMQQNNDKIVSLTESLSDIRLEYELKQHMIIDIQNVSKDRELLLSEKQTIENELKKAHKKLEALKIARLALTNAYSEYRSSFSPILAENAGRILKSITDSKYETTAIDDELRLSVNSPFGYKIAESISRGSIQQAEFAKRLALCEIILDGKTPIFLDDAFAFFDQKRLENALNYLVNISFGTQVFFSSCRNAELDLINKKDINILFFD